MYRNKSYTKAIKLLNKLIKLDKKNPLYYFLRGNVHTDRAKFEKAIKEYTKAIDLDNTDERYYRYRAQAYSYYGQSSLEAEDLKKSELLNKEQHQYKSFANEEMLKRINNLLETSKKQKNIDEGEIFHIEGVKNWWYNLSEHIK